MCGIAALIGLPRDDDAKLASTLLARLRHRGPDGSGRHDLQLDAGHRAVLLHTRLAIRDLSPAGAQPMTDPPTGNVLIFNGEIYNQAALRSQLAPYYPVSHYRSSSDTEVLLNALTRWGADALPRLDGMFALVFVDNVRRRIVVARDHLGIKPLYFCRYGSGGHAFASEVRALVHSGLCRRTIDPAAIGDFLSLGSVQEPRTLFTDISAFPAAHVLELPFDGGPGTSRRYWSPPAERTDAPDACADHRACLEETIRQQTAADVPVGIFLSGGIDSTVLARLVAGTSAARLANFSIATPRTQFDEIELARETAARLDLVHVTKTLESEEVAAWLEDGLDAMDQPSGDGINTYLVSRASRQHGIVVALAGIGADEIHGGYDHFYTLGRLWQDGPDERFLRAALQRNADDERLALLRAACGRPLAALREIRRYFAPSWIAAHAPVARHALAAGNVASGAALASELTQGELDGYLRNTLLRDSDWATMANGQELRVPYLGRQYVEQVLSTPWSVRQRADRCNKPLLSRLIADRCAHILHRPKYGFTLDYYAMLTRLEPHRLAAREDVLHACGFRLPAGGILSGLGPQQVGREARRAWALVALGRYLEQHADPQRN